MILLDVGLPGKNGIDILKFLKDAHPEIKVLMLSMYPEDQYALRALKAGAFGYLNKASAPEQLMDAIKQIMGGRKYITPDIAQALVESLGGGNSDALPHTKLSDREYQTLCLWHRAKSSPTLPNRSRSHQRR
jgi:DNA-binding NarL/FixJ family response regulator